MSIQSILSTCEKYMQLALENIQAELSEQKPSKGKLMEYARLYRTNSRYMKMLEG